MGPNAYDFLLQVPSFSLLQSFTSFPIVKSVTLRAASRRNRPSDRKATTMEDTAAKARLRRTRTGCFKCRIRRRKCDEGKPSCRRCIDGGFECQYGTRLSFLEKNARTIRLPGGVPKSSKPYPVLKFVVPESSATGASVRFQDKPIETSASEKASTAESADQALSSESIDKHHEYPDLSLIDAPDKDFVPPDTPLAPLRHHPQPSSTEQPRELSNRELHTPGSFEVGTSPGNAACETALDVLPSLGADSYAPPEAPVTSNTSNMTQDADYIGSLLSSRSRMTPAASETHGSVIQLNEEFPNCAHLPQDRVVKLMRHYRYNIAPWLDIGDPGQTFGLAVSRIALKSMPVLESLLALSLGSLDHAATMDLRQQGILPTFPPPIELTILDGLLVFAFGVIRQYLTTSPSSWCSPFEAIGFEPLCSALSQKQDISVSLAISWTVLRLDLSVGLISNSSVLIPDALAFGTPISVVDLSRDSLGFGRGPLLLCARVLNYCFGQEPATSPGAGLPLSKTQRWKSLFESLNMWYNNRPKEFKPMIELEENEQLFPLVLFTNGAAVLANQLCHTSILLLLQNRPRTLQHEYGRSFLTSPLWHAQRICGISLNNDSRANWDFSMVASLYVAAKRMTYKPQQQAILAGLDRINSITKWNLSQLATQLVQEWQPA